MITTLTGVNAEIQARYFKLFDKASDFLSVNGIDTYVYMPIELNVDTYESGKYFLVVADSDPISYELDIAEAFDPLKKYYTKQSGIRTLDDYFMHLGDIMEGDDSKSPDNKKAKFLMLSLNEDYFVIDNNTRNISVPSSFARNGIGVAGDRAAETLLFKVDRYFDIMDLLETEIFIQWENSAGDQKVSKIDTLIDAETFAQEGKIVFGWPISDLATSVAGPIKFAVRFIQKAAGDSISYSLSSLPATVKINNSLNFDMFDSEMDLEFDDLFTDIIRNSQNLSAIAPAEPVFVVNSDGSLIIGEDDAIEYSAYIADKGTLTYIFYYKKDKDTRRVKIGNAVEDGAQAEEDVNEYYKVKQEYRKVAEGGAFTADARNYYIQSGDDVIGMVRDFTLTPGTKVEAADNIYFERFVTLTIDGAKPEGTNDVVSPVAGAYYAIAYNTLNGRQSDNQGGIVTVVDAEPPIFEKNITIPNKGIIETEDGEIEASIKAVSPAGEIEYIWYSTTDQSLQGQDNEDLVIAGATGATLPITEDGFYWAKAMNSLNLGRKTLMSEVGKVTHNPIAPVWADEWANSDELFKIDKTNKVIEMFIKDTFDTTNMLQSDAVTFKWYIADGEDEGSDDDLWIDSNDTRIAWDPVNRKVTLTLDDTLVSFPGSNWAYCVATNILNGKEAISAPSIKFVIA